MSELERLLAGTDEAVLVALANLGLVKRARKDLERETPQWLSRDEHCWRLQLEGFEVCLVAPWSRSTCQCPAHGMCRHILAALLFAQQTLEGAVEEPFDPEEVLSLTLSQLEVWAGKPLVRKAEKMLGEHSLQVTVEASGSRGILRIPSQHYECRWLRGGGLESLVCSCHASEPCVHRLACLLAWLRQAGRLEAKVGPVELREKAGVVRSRPEVLASLGQVLAEMATLGTSRLSGSTAERLQTLAMSARGVDLPRLAKLLRALEDEVRAVLGRQARASTRGWLATAAYAEALRVALAGPAPPPGLIGTHKASFLEVPGTLALSGVGARRFVTRSGYVGLTVYFRDPAGGWLYWTEARPAGGLDALARYRQDGPWQGCADPLRASRSELRLAGAWKSPTGGLSGRASTRALVVGPTLTEPLREQAVRDWGELQRRAPDLLVGGLQEPRESQRLVLLAPTDWEPAGFDPIQQRLELDLLDREGGRLPLRLGFSAEHRAAISWLERTALAGSCLLGVLQLAEELYVEPISVIRDDEITHLTLDLEQGQSGPSPALVEPSEDDEEPFELELPEVAGDSPLLELLDAISWELEQLGEAGTRSGRDLAELARLTGRLESLGLLVCAGLLRSLAELRADSEGGLALLRAAYAVSLQRRLAAL